MKYHEKLNLRSPVFKHIQSSKSPSRSPKAINNKQFLNAAELFQKVCCPNCKYGFKIIKGQSLIQNKKKIDESLLNKPKKIQNRQIQTDWELLTIQQNFNNTSKLYSKPKSFQLNSKLELSRRNQISRINQILGTSNTNTSYLKQSDYKFKPLSLTPKNLKSKSNQLLKTLQNQNISLFKKPSKIQTSQLIKESQLKQIPQQISQTSSPKKQTFLISPQTPNKNTLKLQISKIQNDKKIAYQEEKQQRKSILNSKKMDLEQNNSKITYQKQVRNLKNESALINQIVKKIQNQNVMKQLISYCKELKTQNQIPAYCKMLLYEPSLQ